MKNRKLVEATKIRWPVGLPDDVFYRGYGPFTPHHFKNRCALTHAVVAILGFSYFNKHEKLILMIVVAKSLNEGGLQEAWLSYDELAGAAGISKPTVIKVVTSLRERGYLILKMFDNDKDESDNIIIYQIGKKVFFNRNFEDGMIKCTKKHKDE